MRKIIYWVHTSIDGFVNGPNGEFDWPVFGKELAAYSNAMNERVDTFLYGRKVWELMSSYWPTADQASTDEHDLHFAPIWRRMPKIVFSRTLREAGWNTRIMGGDLLGQVTALKARPGKDLLLNGGAHLAAALTELGLIDEYQVIVHPVVLGGGVPLFANPAERISLRLTETQTFDGQTVLLNYQP